VVAANTGWDAHAECMEAQMFAQTMKIASDAAENLQLFALWWSAKCFRITKNVQNLENNEKTTCRLFNICCTNKSNVTRKSVIV